MTLDKIRQDDASAVSLNDIASAHVMRPIMTFDENMREYYFNERARFVFIEDDDALNRTQRRENCGTISFRVYRSSRSLIAAHGGIAV